MRHWQANNLNVSREVKMFTERSLMPKLDDRSYRKEIHFGSPEWAALRGKSPDDIKDDFKYFLRRACLDWDSGNIKMTEGYSSILTTLFTNVLVSLDAFTRSSDLLDERQRFICFLHFRKGMEYKQIAEEVHYSERTVKREINTAIDSMLFNVMEIVFWKTKRN